MLEPATPVPPDFLTLDEAAVVVRVGRSTAYREANAFEASGGKTGIPVIHYGKLFRVPRYRLEEQLGGPITWPLPTDFPIIAATTRPSRPVTSLHHHASHEPADGTQLLVDATLRWAAKQGVELQPPRQPAIEPMRIELDF